MMELCSSVPDIKLTRERQNSISGWVNPYQRRRRRGKRVAKLGNKKYINGLFGSNIKSETRDVISHSIESEIRSLVKKASRWRIIFPPHPINAADICVFSMQA